MSEPEKVSNVARHELQRALSFIVVFDLNTARGIDEELTEEFFEPYQILVNSLLETYPSLEPTIDQNPAEVIYTDLDRMGLLDNGAVVDMVNYTREFFNENPDRLPMTLEVTTREGDASGRQE